MQDTIDQICTQLTERNRAAVQRVVTAIGAEQALALLAQALEIEAHGGMLTHKGERRRTPGGVFFQLARQIVPKDLYKQVFLPTYHLRRAKQQRELAKRRQEGTDTTAVEQKAQPDSPAQDTIAPTTISGSPPNQPPTEKGATAPVAPPLTWEEAKALVRQVIQTPGEAQTVKLTLIGRPQKIIAQQECVVVSLKGKVPPSLPKGLPPVPDGSAITWAVFIVTKQWNRVKASLEANADDQLIIEGYPLVGKNGIAAVMATNCKSVLMERAQRERQKTEIAP